MKRSVCIGLMLVAAAVFAQTIEYPHVQDNGGGFKTDATYRSYASIGQPVIGKCSNVSYTNQAGYISGISCCVKIEEKPPVATLPAKPTVGLPYPNPFNSVCQIDVSIPEGGDIRFEIYDLNGRKLYEQAENKNAGSYSLKFDAGNLQSGMYIYTVSVSNFVQKGKLMLVK